MKLFRKTIFWLHLVIGLVVAIGVALLAGTGLVLAFERPIVAWAERVEAGPKDAKSAPWSIEELLERAKEIQPDATPTALTVSAGANDPVAVQFGRDRVTYLNAYTGEKVGTEATALRGFFHTNLELHRQLTLSGDWRSLGRNITGAAAVGFLVLIVSGLWLWMPRRFSWPAIRAVLVPSLRLKGKTRDWNWHNALGFWALLPLLIITLTANVISYTWASNLLYRAVGEQPPPPREQRQRPANAQPQGNREGGRENNREGGERREGERAPRPLNVEGLNDLFADAVTYNPNWTSINLRLGNRRGEGEEGGEGGQGGRGNVSFVVSQGDTTVPFNRVTLHYSRQTGERTRVESFGDNTLGRRLRMLVVPTHRGEVLGNFGRSIAALACVAALVLVYTGLALSYRRLVRPVLARVKFRRQPVPSGAPLESGVLLSARTE
ncbi:MAG TPA: PepSY-associated TM helix domain-containing protein [Tepidisphaeraceae bacterium]